MPARTSAKTHKRHRPKSRVKPRKSKPRKRTARKNGKRGKPTPTRRRRVRGADASAAEDPNKMPPLQRLLEVKPTLILKPKPSL